MNFRSPAVIVLCFSTTILFGQISTLDSLYRVLQDYPKEDTNRVKTLINICHAEYTSYPEKSKLHAEELRLLSGKINYAYGIGMSLRYFSFYYWTKGNYEEAAQYAFSMVNFFEKHPNTDGLYKAYLLVGLIHDEWNDFEKARKYYLKALDLNQLTKRNYDMAYTYNSLGTLYFKFNKIEEAIDYYQKSLRLRKQINDKTGISQSYSNLGQCASEKKEYKEAIAYFNMALPSAKKINNIRRLIIINEGLGECYSFMRQYQIADAHLQHALDMSRQLGNKYNQSSVYSTLLTMEQQRGNFKKALEYSFLANALKDSIFNEERAKKVSELEARYETDKKEQAIKLLESDNKIKTLWQSILAGSLGIMMIGGVLFYAAQRQRIKKDRELLRIQREVNQKLKEVDNMKSQFFASISHEFRTPLTLIKGPVDESLKHPDHPIAHDSLAMISRNANRLLRLVNQLLDLSKLDTGNLRLQMQDGDVHKFLRTTASAFESYAQQHGISYRVDIADIPLFRSFDHDKLEKIVYNLLSNAFKFTPGGGQVSCSTTSSGECLTISVSDNGAGIDRQHLPYIFDRFYLAGNDETAMQEGTGIGLALVRELVTLMQGEIHVHSEKEKGSTFTVSLRLKIVSAVESEITLQRHPVTVMSAGNAPKENEPVVNTEMETVLVVEDNADMRAFIREQLISSYQVIVAANGKEGLSIARNEIPELIITDVMMPHMDGMAFCEAVKKDEYTSHIPVIMLTAKEGRDNKLEGLETGADDYLTKPFDTGELAVRIKNLIAQRKHLRLKFSQQITLQPKNIAITSIDKLFLQKVENAIEENISLPEFGVPQLQEQIGMGKTQLHRKMKALTDQAPGEFLRNYRLKRARQILEQRAMNVTEAAYATGFSSQSYFTRAFTEYFSTSPSEHVKNLSTPKSI